MTIAVDFDGTIVEHKYPAIGKENFFAFETLKALKKDGHKLILWTSRSGKELEAAVNFCRENGVEFYAVNHDLPHDEYKPETDGRKIVADMYIDDRNFGGFPGWGEIYQAISGNNGENYWERYNKKRKYTFEGIIDRIFKKKDYDS